MRKLSAFICVHLWLIISVCGQDFTSVANGIEHAKFTRKIKDEPVNINLLRLDLTEVRLDVVHALDAAVGLETTSSIATRHGAIAAINAGFFKMTGVYNGDAAGVLQIDGKLLSESYGNRIAMLISNSNKMTEVNFAHLDIQYSISIGKNTTLDIDGVNRQRGKDETIIFTPEFHRTTLTDQNGIEIVVRNGKISQILNTGSNLIPHDGFVISTSGTKQQQAINVCRINAKVSLGSSRPWYYYDDESERKRVEKKEKPLSKINDKDFEKAEDIVGGVPQLIKNGKIEITWEQEKIGKEFVETKHPRTAVAKLKDGRFLMITVDGRSESSSGISLPNLAEMLLELGAVDAMNLDGGGSTTMFVKDKVVNVPSDKTGERPVSDAILVFPRKSK